MRRTLCGATTTCRASLRWLVHAAPCMSLWPVAVDIPVTWRDMDAAGHVNNAVYFTYMETARVETYFRMTGGRRAPELDIILARTSCDFRSPAQMGDVLVVNVSPIRVGEKSFTLAYRICDKATDRLVAEGESVQVMFDYATNRGKRVPDELRKLLEAGLS